MFHLIPYTYVDMGTTMGKKNITVTLILTVLLVCLIAPFASSYEIVQESYEILENGNVAVSLSVQDYQQDTFDLPENINPNTVTVEPQQDTNETTISYTTSYLTRKEKGIWYFESYNFSPQRVEVLFSPSVQIVRSQPPASIQSGSQLIFYWTGTNSPVSVSFVFTNTQTARPQETEQEQSDSDSLTLFLAALSGAVLVLIIGMAVIMRRKPRKRQDPQLRQEQVENPDEQPQKRPDITEGQMNIIRTANPNASKIITLLLRHNNHMKRTELEKESGLAKSSLASTLNSLEKKGIIAIDRSFHIHHIKLSDWFQTI